MGHADVRVQRLQHRHGDLDTWRRRLPVRDDADQAPDRRQRIGLSMTSAHTPRANADARARGISAVLALTLLATPIAHAIDIGAHAPDFDLPRLGSDTHLHLADLRGKVVLIDFWASWCGPCREALPQYDKLYGELARTDFEIVAVNLDEDVADAKKFLGAHPVRYPIALGSAGAVPKLFGLIGMPTSYLVDRNGVVRLSYQGFKPQDLDTLRTTIGKLAKETSHAQ